MRPVVHSTLAATLLLVASCGPLAPSEFGGEPLFRVLGNASIDPPSQAGTTPPRPGRLGIFWNPKGPVAFAAFEELVEQPSIGKDITLPQQMDWDLTEEPPEAVRLATAGGRRYALGRIYAYDDANGNRKRDAGEAMLATTAIGALFFAVEAIPGDDSPIGRWAIPKGFSVVTMPFHCPPAPEWPAHEGECGVPLGNACATDADCSGGACLTKPVVQGTPPWPEGVCAIKENAETQCRPKDGALWINHRDQSVRYWVKGCTKHEDCPRGTPYQCDFARGACMPSRLTNLTGNPANLQPGGYCMPPAAP